MIITRLVEHTSLIVIEIVSITKPTQIRHQYLSHVLVDYQLPLN